MAAAAVRAQLEALMASAIQQSGESALKFTDDGVCKDFLCGLCPHDMFANTKVDMGKCDKVHSERLKAEYEEARKLKDYGFDYEWVMHMDDLVRERDKKIARDRQQLDETQNKDMDANYVALLKQIADVDDKIGTVMSDMERLGSEGKVEESLAKVKEQEELAVVKKRLEDELHSRDDKQSIAQRQKLRVCDICGAKLSLFDSDRRLADHFGGKMHLGYAQMRDIVKSMRDKVQPVARPRPAPEERRDSDRDRDRGDRRDRDRDRDYRDRDRDRDHRDRDRDRDRGDRDRDRNRDRDRDRGRDYDRHRDRRRSRSPR